MTAPAGSPGPSTPNDNPSHRIRLVPHIDNRRNLRFEAVTRDLKEGDTPLRIGRFTDRSGLGLAAVNALTSHKLAFKSKVVSRAHAEIWAEVGGKFYIKDTKSSSGTFLNHVRLSPANTESKPHQIKDGDVLQFGVDYQGGTEDIYKSVKIRIELGREWQSTANAFNTNAVKNIKALAGPPPTGKAPTNGKAGKTQLGDCCICLFPVTIRQCLFITPCSHTFHYKCLRPLLESLHPSFSCPLCRTYADLDEDVEVDVEVEEDHDDVSPVPSLHGGDDVLAPDALAPPVRETGAETEVEGDAGSGLVLRSNNPFAEAAVTRRNNNPFERRSPEIVEEDLDVVEELAPSGSRAMMDVDTELGGTGAAMDDVDATIGGKRKR